MKEIQNDDYELLFRESVNGIALHEMVYDENGAPVDYRFLRVNRAFEKFTGLQGEEIVGKTVKQVLPETEDFWITRYAGVVRTGESYSFEHYSRALDRYYEGNAYKTSVNGFAVTFTDVTHRFKQSRALEQEKNFLEAIFSAVQDGLNVLDADLKIVKINPAIQELYDDNVEICGKKCHVVFQKRGTPCDSCPSIRALSTGQKQTATVPFPSVARPEKWFHLTAAPVKSSDGTITGVVEHVADVTKRIQAEEQLKWQNSFLETVVESLPYPFLVVNVADFTVVKANRLAAPAGLIPGITCHELTHRSLKPCAAGDDHSCPLQMVMQTGKPVVMEHIHYDGQGDEQFVEVHGYPIFSPDGRVVQMIEYGVDITERKRQEQEKERLILELRKTIDDVKKLRGMLPICSWCKKIRNDEGYWQQIESYISLHAEVDFTHSICPDCMEDKYPDLFPEKK